MATWITIDEIAEYLKVGKSTLYKLAQNGQIPAHKIGRTWRFDCNEIDAWIRGGRKQSSRVKSQKASKKESAITAEQQITLWGRWLVLRSESAFKVKRIEVNPGLRLSYQKHSKRSERWVIVEGKAVVTLDGRDYPLTCGQAFDIPKGVPHRIANPGTKPLVFIEIQQGEYFGEDDIIRLEDDFGRASK